MPPLYIGYGSCIGSYNACHIHSTSLNGCVQVNRVTHALTGVMRYHHLNINIYIQHTLYLAYSHSNRHASMH
ncbi:hypothetical protein Hanom_Chr03g00265711 [Helianthus anomalus]